jgi:eukaryotic-like serine/threonine-protein kinase
VEVCAGRYLLIDQIGDGSSGPVWRAWDARQRAYVAAKLLQPADAGYMLRFAREHSSRLVHPHVVAPTGWASDGERVLLTMDLVRGGSVSDLLGDDRRLPMWLAGVLVEHVLVGLAAIHQQGIVHLNVKPSNLLLEPTTGGRPFLRLADFGVAAAGGEPRPGHIKPDPRQDLYAAGVVAFQLLTGRTPVVGTRPACPDGVPEVVWGPLRSLLAPSPSDRPTSADAAVQAWRKAFASVDVAPAQADPVQIPDRVGPLPEGFDAAYAQPADDAQAVSYAQPADNAQAEQSPPASAGEPASWGARDTHDGIEAGEPERVAGASASTATGNGPKAVAAAIVAVVLLVGIGFVASAQALGRNQAAVDPKASPAAGTVGPGSSPSQQPAASLPTSAPVTPSSSTATAQPGRSGSRPTSAPPRYVATSAFQPFGATFTSFPLGASGSLLTIGSPATYEHLWGAWLPGAWCTMSASFDISLNAPIGPSPGYGYAVAPQSTVSNDQPAGWSMQHEWDGGQNGFFTRPVLLPDGAWAGGGSSPAGDVRGHHHVTVSAGGTRYSMTIDGVSLGTFSGPSTCGSLALRVWGGATVQVDHIVISH